jgi:hypothetical protein
MYVCRLQKYALSYDIYHVRGNAVRGFFMISDVTFA